MLLAIKSLLSVENTAKYLERSVLFPICNCYLSNLVCRLNWQTYAWACQALKHSGVSNAINSAARFSANKIILKAYLHLYLFFFLIIRLANQMMFTTSEIQALVEDIGIAAQTFSLSKGENISTP